MRRLILLVMVSAALAPIGAARADDCAGTATASGDRPAAIDLTEDWTGNLGARSDTSATIPAGDIYRGGTDITKAWISGTSGHLVAHVGVGDAIKLDRGAQFYFEWTHGDVPPNALDASGIKEAVRFVQAIFKGYEEEYIWGYISPTGGATGGAVYRTDGNTTGRVIEGPNGEIQIDLPTGDTKGIVSGAPASDWGSPSAGDLLTNVASETFVVLGTPETLPSNPSGLRHGFLEPVDDSVNGSGPDGGDVCEIVVDA